MRWLALTSLYGDSSHICSLTRLRSVVQIKQKCCHHLERGRRRHWIQSCHWTEYLQAHQGKNTVKVVAETVSDVVVFMVDLVRTHRVSKKSVFGDHAQWMRDFNNCIDDVHLVHGSREEGLHNFTIDGIDRYLAVIILVSFLTRNFLRWFD